MPTDSASRSLLEALRRWWLREQARPLFSHLREARATIKDWKAQR